MSSNVSLENPDSGVINPPEEISQPSAKRARNRRRAPSTTKYGPQSSPLAPTRSGLTPDQPQVRRSSVQLPVYGAASPSIDSTSSQAYEEVDGEIETPTRKRRRTSRARPKSSQMNKTRGSSPLRQIRVPDTDFLSNQNKTETSRPPLASSNTSPETHEKTKRNLRSNITERSVTEPVTPGKKLSGFQLDADIEQLIKDGPKRDKGKEKENGSIYLYRAKPRGSELWLLKIGRTQKHVKERLAQIKGACGHLEMEEHTKAVARDIPFHGFAEKLIHAELSNYQHQWLCDCGTRHREYFLVDEDIAVKVFERWRDFCQERPWARDGKILPKWARRLQNRAKFSGEDRDFDHQEFARRWTAFAAPMSFERFLSDAVHIWKLAFPNRWLIISLAELLTIVCTSRHTFWASTWTTIIVVLLLADLVVTENMHTTAHILRLMEGGLQSFSVRQRPPEDTAVVETEFPTPESSQDSAIRQESDGEAVSEPREGNASAHTSQNQTYPRHAVNYESEDDLEGFTDDEDDWIRDFRSPASPDTASTKKLSNTSGSQNTYPGKKSDQWHAN